MQGVRGWEEGREVTVPVLTWDPRRPWNGLEGDCRGVGAAGESCFGDVHKGGVHGGSLRHRVEEGGVEEGPVVRVRHAHGGVPGKRPR